MPTPKPNPQMLFVSVEGGLGPKPYSQMLFVSVEDRGAIARPSNSIYRCSVHLWKDMWSPNSFYRCLSYLWKAACASVDYFAAAVVGIGGRPW